MVSTSTSAFTGRRSPGENGHKGRGRCGLVGARHRLFLSPPSLIRADETSGAGCEVELDALALDQFIDAFGQYVTTLLETQVQPVLAQGRYPERKTGRPVAEILRAIAKDLDILFHCPELEGSSPLTPGGPATLEEALA